MLWLKTFHIVFVVAWFAGLLYLPRLFVYHAMAEDQISLDRFVVMERKLFAIMTVGALAALACGVGILIAVPSYLSQGWLHVKLVLVGFLIAYHAYCAKLMRSFRAGKNRREARFYRFFNEVPALALIVIAYLVVFKPL